jgi:hypothetical protein
MTPRWEKEHGDYSVFDFREELEYGLTDNFQVSLYLNHHYVYANDDFPATDPSHPRNRLPGAYETGCEDVHARSQSSEAVRQLSFRINIVRTRKYYIRLKVGFNF